MPWKPLVVAIEVAAVTLVTGGLLSASAAGPIYHWITDDGTYAFTDQKKKIPARYQDGAEVRPRRSLRGYARYTPVATPKRAVARSAVASAAPAQAPLTDMQTAISIRTGGPYSHSLDITPVPDQGPVVIEKKRYKASGTAVTRTYTIVRQGDRVLTVIKPQLHETNVTEFGDEDEFEIE